MSSMPDPEVNYDYPNLGGRNIRPGANNTRVPSGVGPHHRGIYRGGAKRVDVCPHCSSCVGCCCEGEISYDPNMSMEGMRALSEVSGAESCTPNSNIYNPPGDTYMVRFINGSVANNSLRQPGSQPWLKPYQRPMTHWADVISTGTGLSDHTVGLPAGSDWRFTSAEGSGHGLRRDLWDIPLNCLGTMPPPYVRAQGLTGTSTRSGLTPNTTPGIGVLGNRSSNTAAYARVENQPWRTKNTYASSTPFYWGGGETYRNKSLCEIIDQRMVALGAYGIDGVPFAFGNSSPDRAFQTSDFHPPGPCEWSYASTGYPILGAEVSPGNCSAGLVTTIILPNIDNGTIQYGMQGYALVASSANPFGTGVSTSVALLGSGSGCSGNDYASGTCSPVKIPLVFAPPTSHYVTKRPEGTYKPASIASGTAWLDAYGRLDLNSIQITNDGSGYLVPPGITLSGVSYYSNGGEAEDVAHETWEKCTVFGEYPPDHPSYGGGPPFARGEFEVDCPDGALGSAISWCVGPDIGFGPGRAGRSGNAPGYVPTQCSPGPYHYNTSVRLPDTRSGQGACCGYFGVEYCTGWPAFDAPMGGSFIRGVGNSATRGFSNEVGTTVPGEFQFGRGYTDISAEGGLREMGSGNVRDLFPAGFTPEGPAHGTRARQYVHKIPTGTRDWTTLSGEAAFPSRTPRLSETIFINGLPSGERGPISDSSFNGSCGGDGKFPTHASVAGAPHDSTIPYGGRWCPSGNGRPWTFSTVVHNGTCCAPLGREWDCGSVGFGGFPKGGCTQSQILAGLCTDGTWSCCGASATNPKNCASGGGVWFNTLSVGNDGSIDPDKFTGWAPPCCDKEDWNSKHNVRHSSPDAGATYRTTGGCYATKSTGDPTVYYVVGTGTGNFAYYCHTCTECSGEYNDTTNPGPSGCIEGTGLVFVGVGTDGSPIYRTGTGYWNSSFWEYSGCPVGSFGETHIRAGDGEGQYIPSTRETGCITGNPANCGCDGTSYSDIQSSCAPDDGVPIWGHSMFGCDPNWWEDGVWHGVWPSAQPCPGGISSLSTQGDATPRLILQCHRSDDYLPELTSSGTLTYDSTTPRGYKIENMSSSSQASFLSNRHDLARKFPEWLAHTGTGIKIIDHFGNKGATSGIFSSGNAVTGGSGMNQPSYRYGFWTEGGSAGCRDMNPIQYSGGVPGFSPPYLWHPSGAVDWKGIPSGSDWAPRSGWPSGNEASEGIGDFMDASGQMHWPRLGESIYDISGNPIHSGIYVDKYPYGSSGTLGIEDKDHKTGCRVRAYMLYDFFPEGQNFISDADGVSISKGPAGGELEQAGHGASGNCTMHITRANWEVSSDNILSYNKEWSTESGVGGGIHKGSGFFETPSVKFVSQSGTPLCGPSSTPPSDWGTGYQPTFYDSGLIHGDRETFSRYHEPQGSGASGYVEMEVAKIYLSNSGQDYLKPPNIVIEPSTEVAHAEALDGGWYAGNPTRSKSCVGATGDCSNAHASVTDLSGTIVEIRVLDPGGGYFLNDYAQFGPLVSNWAGPPAIQFTNPDTDVHSLPTCSSGLSGDAVMAAYEVYMCDGGCNYTDDFTVTIHGGGEDRAATGLAIVDKCGQASQGSAGCCGSVVGVRMLDKGIGFTSLPTVDFSAGNGTGASGLASIGVEKVVIKRGDGFGCWGYYSWPWGADNFEDFVLGAQLYPRLSSPLTTQGSCKFNAGEEFALKGIHDGNARITLEFGSGYVAAMHLDLKGSCYKEVPKLKFENQSTDMSGVGASGICEMSLTDIKMSNKGSGYILPPEVFFECEGKMDVFKSNRIDRSDPAQVSLEGKLSSTGTHPISRCLPSFELYPLLTGTNNPNNQEYAGAIIQGVSSGVAFTVGYMGDKEGVYGRNLYTSGLYDCPRFSVPRDFAGDTVDAINCWPNGANVDYHGGSLFNSDRGGVYMGVDQVHVKYGGDKYDEFGRAIHYRMPGHSRIEYEPSDYVCFSPSGSLLHAQVGSPSSSGTGIWVSGRCPQASPPFVRFDTRSALKTRHRHPVGLRVFSCSKLNSNSDPNNLDRSTGKKNQIDRPFDYDTTNSNLNKFCGASAYVNRLDTDYQVATGTSYTQSLPMPTAQLCESGGSPPLPGGPHKVHTRMSATGDLNSPYKLISTINKGSGYLEYGLDGRPLFIDQAAVSLCSGGPSATYGDAACLAAVNEAGKPYYWSNMTLGFEDYEADVMVQDAGDYYIAAPNIHFMGLVGYRNPGCHGQYFDGERNCNDLPVTPGRSLYPSGERQLTYGNYTVLHAKNPSGNEVWPLGEDVFFLKHLQGALGQSSMNLGDLYGRLAEVGPDRDAPAGKHVTVPGGDVIDSQDSKWLEINSPINSSLDSSYYPPVGASISDKYTASAIWICDDFNCEASSQERNKFYLASGWHGDGALCSLPFGVEVWNPNSGCEIKGSGRSALSLTPPSLPLQSPPLITRKDADFLMNQLGPRKFKSVEYVKRSTILQSKPKAPTPLINGRYYLENPQEPVSAETSPPVEERVEDYLEIPPGMTKEEVERLQSEALERNSDERGGIVKQTRRYLSARDKWVQADKPIRTKEEISEIYDICQKCPHFTGSACSLCGCRITMQGNFMNKLAWATESCPDNPPRWGPKE